MSKLDPWYFQRWAYNQKVGNPIRKSVLTMLAIMADANTGRCEAKQEMLLTAVEAGERAVRNHLVALEQMGLIARRAQFRIDRGRRGDEFLLLAPGIDAWPDGEPVQRIVHPAPDAGGEDVHPAPDAAPPGTSGYPPRGTGDAGQELPPTSEQPLGNNDIARTASDAGCSSTWTYHRKQVPKWAAERALGAFAAFAERAGQKIEPFRPSNGRPSEALTLITGAVLDHPDVDADTWSRLITAAFADPWWTGVPSPGVVFGPKVLDRGLQALANPDAVSGNGRRRAPAGEKPFGLIGDMSRFDNQPEDAF